jgi:hypothetical protein
MKATVKFTLLTLMLALGVSAFSQTKPKTPAKHPKAGLIYKLGVHSVTLQGCTDATSGVSFNFYRGSSAGSESTTPLNSTPQATCSFVDTTVAANTTYYYIAKAYLATAAPPGLSGPSNELTVTIPPDPTPAAPTGLGLGTVAKNDVPLHWGPPPAQGGYIVVAYEVMRGTAPTLPGPAIVAILPSATTAWIDDGGCTKCYYAVRSMTIKEASSIVLSPLSNIVGPA